VEYDEHLVVKVFDSSTKTNRKNLLCTVIESIQKFNSSFYFSFGKNILVSKEKTFSIEVYPEEGAKYHLIPEIQVRKNLRDAKCRAEKRELDSSTGLWRISDEQNCIIKSILLVPVE